VNSFQSIWTKRVPIKKIIKKELKELLFSILSIGLRMLSYVQACAGAGIIQIPTPAASVSTSCSTQLGFFSGCLHAFGDAFSVAFEAELSCSAYAVCVVIVAGEIASPITVAITAMANIANLLLLLFC
jgi:hypothetical protein